LNNTSIIPVLGIENERAHQYYQYKYYIVYIHDHFVFH
jgi:hypothetical protein